MYLKRLELVEAKEHYAVFRELPVETMDKLFSAADKVAGDIDATGGVLTITPADEAEKPSAKRKVVKPIREDA